MNTRAAGSTTRKRIDEITEGVESATTCKRQHAARVEWYLLCGALNIQISAKAKRMVAGSVRERVLYLVVVEEAALRKDEGRPIDVIPWPRPAPLNVKTGPDAAISGSRAPKVTSNRP